MHDVKEADGLAVLLAASGEFRTNETVQPGSKHHKYAPSSLNRVKDFSVLRDSNKRCIHKRVEAQMVALIELSALHCASSATFAVLNIDRTLENAISEDKINIRYSLPNR